MFDKFQNYLYDPQTVILSALILAMLIILIKQYAKGGTCYFKTDMTGKLVVITGCNTGIGEQTAYELAKLGANIVLANRSQERTNKVLQQLNKNFPKQQFTFMQLDLSSLSSVKNFTSQFGKKFDKLDMLINNAGVMAYPQRLLSPDGIEMQFATNHLGHFYLTNLLIEYLKKVECSRIINLSSMGHAMTKKGDRIYDDVIYEKNYMDWIAYGHSKLANVLHAKQLQRQFDSEKINIKIVSLHPGMVRTELMRQLTGIQKIVTLYTGVFNFISKSSLQGAQTTLHCALIDYKDLVGGAYYSDCKVKQSSKQSNDKVLAQELWKKSQQLIDECKNI